MKDEVKQRHLLSRRSLDWYRRASYESPAGVARVVNEFSKSNQFA